MPNRPCDAYSTDTDDRTNEIGPGHADSFTQVVREYALTNRIVPFLRLSDFLLELAIPVFTIPDPDVQSARFEWLAFDFLGYLLNRFRNVVHTFLDDERSVVSSCIPEIDFPGGRVGSPWVSSTLLFRSYPSDCVDYYQEFAADMHPRFRCSGSTPVGLSLDCRRSAPGRTWRSKTACSWGTARAITLSIIVRAAGLDAGCWADAT